ncbi:hypothetical protein LZ32DRAFT_26002 [Colletotrichum eremochloae]|nr:hypothetical protein LZ32DRAFT_26002 [Colletotrichum eremochloae]
MHEDRKKIPGEKKTTQKNFRCQRKPPSPDSQLILPSQLSSCFVCLAFPALSPSLPPLLPFPLLIQAQPLQRFLNVTMHPNGRSLHSLNRESNDRRRPVYPIYRRPSDSCLSRLLSKAPPLAPRYLLSPPCSLSLSETPLPLPRRCRVLALDDP